MNRRDLLDELDECIRSLCGDKARRDRALAVVQQLREAPIDTAEWWAAYGPTRKPFSAVARKLVECILAGMSDARLIAEALGIDVADLPRYVHRVGQQAFEKRAGFTLTLSRGQVSTHSLVIVRGPKLGR